MLDPTIPRYAQAPADAAAGAAPGAAAADPAAVPPDDKGAAPAAIPPAADPKGAAPATTPASLLTAAPEKKTDPAAATDPGAGKKPDGTPPADPAKAEPFVAKMPDGFKADEELLADLGKLDLPNERKQEIVDLGVKLQQKAHQALIAAHEAQNEKWISEVKTDKEIGGAKLQASLENGLAALKRFAGTDYAAIESELVRTGLGNHRAFIALFNRVHLATSPDDTASRVRRDAAGAPPNSQQALHAKLYPKMTEQLDQEKGS